MTECGGGSFCKEDFQNLEIPESLKEWVQLAGLGDGSKILEDLDDMDEIMRDAAHAANDDDDDDTEEDDDEEEDN